MKEGFPHPPFQGKMPHYYSHHFWKFMKHGPCPEKHEKEGENEKVVHNAICVINVIKE